MSNDLTSKLEIFQEYIKYKFKDVNLLRQALTTSLYGKENNTPDYQILETLGDAVIKLILSIKFYQKGIIEPEILTKKKQILEDKDSFLKIALEMGLDHFIIASKNQVIRGTKILGDIFESICGAIFIDSKRDLKLIEDLIIDRFIKDWDEDFQESLHLSKNQLLEFLQKRLKYTPKLEFEYESISNGNRMLWKVINLYILNQDGEKVISLPSNLETDAYNSQKEAEKHMSRIVLTYLKKNEQD